MRVQINGRDLQELGYTEGKILGLALRLNKKRTGYSREEMLLHYKHILNRPAAYIDNKIFAPLAKALIEEANVPVKKEIALKTDPAAYAIFGAAGIEEGAKAQMDVAMKLPVTVAGALMPDAHQGYGLPIGGVLATRNAVIPYGVGVDIGCRMALTVFDIPEAHFYAHEALYKAELIKHTKFGAGQGFSGRDKAAHAVLDSADFNVAPFIRQLHDKAYTQLGSSGGGNHFVEWGIIDFSERDATLNIEKGKYLALLTHSGSRGLGAAIAGHYTQVARSVCNLPPEARNLAYLDLSSEAGQEYWIAMNLAGAYASACHEVIHSKLVKAIGGNILAKIENHHNFAWKEIWNGEEVVVHRKGATPAGKGVMGIIPGSMTAPGFLVRGKGAANAIYSASHGAGRLMSRTKAIQNITQQQMRSILADHKVTLIGAGLDEAPMAYKDIHKVMASQQELVDIVATFIPKMVRMADDGSKED